MPPSTSTPLAKRAVVSADAHAGKEHRRFHQLLERIDKSRERLRLWQEQLPLFAQMHRENIGPLRKRLAEQRRAWALELEQLLLGRKWSRAEAETLSQWAAELVDDLLDDESIDENDTELHALFQRLHGVDRATAEQEHLAEMKALFEDVSGVDLGQDPAASMEDLVQRTQARMRDEAQQQAQARQKRTSKRTGASRQRTAEAERITQTAKEVYRKLAAALHPDRAPADASCEERQLRTDRMAQANAAYAAGDLLALLSLQLQIEQVDASRAAQLSEEQVRHFNRVLSEQLKEVDSEIAEREVTFCRSYGYAPERRPDPAKLGVWIKEESQHILAAEAAIRHDQRLLRNDPAGARRLLKQLAQEMRQEDQLSGLLFRRHDHSRR